MGWLSIEHKGKKLYYEDKGLDYSVEFLQKLRKEYLQSDLQRLPTLEEILLNLDIVLGVDFASYCSNGKDQELVSISGKTKKQPVQPKPKVGDIVAVPFKRNLFGFIQVLEIQYRDAGVIGIYPYLQTKKSLNIALLSDLKFMAQLQVELTGVLWKHWRVIGNLPLPKTLKIENFLSFSPCFVAELKIIELLKKNKLLDKAFISYDNIRASPPKWRKLVRKSLSVVMSFLKQQKLLSEMGLKEIESGKVPSDFCMHSELLTKEGVMFSEVVFETDHMYEDTEPKIKALWEEFKKNK
ncbi:MAG: hypothetical protein DRR16_26055 [Candidatus Parabeggiatoa sp. nov. 3]|jgi:hypothetical protein|nr:MAG: hypothetical protein DRR00_14845 [Gammaproteobacteria bacterium]RKZ60043.1 MAG: hypothetical protein DRQ99_22775 [Gammaproteobacteria bacterium]RKZ79262.1 MAG: hypothetical protein DRR16_26055 [Gammaproteobacteria bacterium]